MNNPLIEKGKKVLVHNGISTRPTWTMITAGKIVKTDKPSMTFGSSTTGSFGFILVDDNGQKHEFSNSFGVIEDTPENRKFMNFPENAVEVYNTYLRKETILKN